MVSICELNQFDHSPGPHLEFEYFSISTKKLKTNRFSKNMSFDFKNKDSQILIPTPRFINQSRQGGTNVPPPDFQNSSKKIISHRLRVIKV